MVWNANLVFGLLNWQDLTNLIYQTEYTKSNLVNKKIALGTIPNILDQFTKPYLQNQIYQAKM